MDVDERLDKLFIDLPEPAAEVGNTTSAVIVGKQLIVCGALPFSEGRMQFKGRLGIELRLDNARMAARMAAVMCLAIAKRELKGDLNKIKRVVMVSGYVASGLDFKDHQKVVDGASELFAQVFGTSGKHAREVFGVISLPNNACVSLTVTFELR